MFDMIVLLVLAFAGLFVSWYIYHSKHRKGALVCIIGKDCNEVVYSKYGRLFFGIPNEILGIGYYLSAILLVLLPYTRMEELAAYNLDLVLFFISFLALISSAIFVYIMAFILKKWCEYCMTSAILTFLIFIIEAVQIM